MKHYLAGLLAAMLVVGCDGAREPSVSLKALMAQQVDTEAKLYWNSVQYIADDKGSRDIFPENDAEWERTRQAAENLGKLGELLQTPAYAEGRGRDWTDLSKGLVQVSKQAENAAVRKDPDAVLEVGATIYNVCTACHMAFPPPVTGAPVVPERAR